MLKNVWFNAPGSSFNPPYKLVESIDGVIITNSGNLSSPLNFISFLKNL
jgi:hypothetical protein